MRVVTPLWILLPLLVVLGVVNVVVWSRRPPEERAAPRVRMALVLTVVGLVLAVSALVLLAVAG